MEVPNVAAQAEVISDVANKAAADIPTEMVVAGFEQTAQRHFSVALDPAEPDDAIRLQDAELRREHDVAHERHHVRRRPRRLTEEIVDERELCFGAEEGADRPEGDAEVARLVLAIVDLRTACIAAEAVADEGADEALGGRRS